jgi:glutathione synthase
MLSMLEQAEAVGVRVVNSPRGLRRAGNKALLPTLAPGDCPAQRVVSSVSAAARAGAELGPQLVLKPVQGSRGIGVLFVDTSVADIKPLAELLLERGPLIVQRRVPGAEHGDLRVLIVNGKALRVEDRPVVIARRPASGELRSNLHQGASAQLGELGERELSLIERIAPRLVALGLSIVGADLMQGRLLELNVYAPGGVGPFESLTGIDVSSVLLRSLLEPD